MGGFEIQGQHIDVMLIVLYNNYVSLSEAIKRVEPSRLNYSLNNAVDITNCPVATRAALDKLHQRSFPFSHMLKLLRRGHESGNLHSDLGVILGSTVAVLALDHYQHPAKRSETMPRIHGLNDNLSLLLPGVLEMATDIALGAADDLQLRSKRVGDLRKDFPAILGLADAIGNEAAPGLSAVKLSDTHDLRRGAMSVAFSLVTCVIVTELPQDTQHQYVLEHSFTSSTPSF